MAAISLFARKSRFGTSDEPYIDPDFGDVDIRRIRGSRYIRLRLKSSGKLSATLPLTGRLSQLRELIDQSRDELLKARDELLARQPKIAEGQTIGSSHKLSVRPGTSLAVSVASPDIVVTLPSHLTLDDDSVQQVLRPAIHKALRKEAKAYLSRRLAYLAETHCYEYASLRFSSAGTRWGSCSTSGTISLNISLMNLPPELIDYVIYHELAHTAEMNHSSAFWDRVAAMDPDYKAHRKSLKNHSPMSLKSL